MRGRSTLGMDAPAALLAVLVVWWAAAGAAGQWAWLGRKQLLLQASPEQVHVSLAGLKHIRVTWITAAGSNLPAKVDYGTAPNTYTASATADGSSSYFYMLYRSGTIHNAVIGPLEDDTRYFYRVAGAGGRELSFKTPPKLGPEVPVTFAVVGDLGQTRWSESTLAHIQQCSYDVLLFAGDLSYADYYQPLWDSFGRLVEPAASSRPWMVTQGNHDVERIPLLARPYKAYNSRWSMPHSESDSPSNLFYSFDVASVHVVMLGSYAAYDQRSEQYAWLQEDLNKVDRSKTPWLIAVVHAPWYNSNAKHRGDGDGMMHALEPMLREAKVDIVFAGHVHAYERTARVYSGQLDECGIMHITIGDGGNREGLARRFRDPQPEWSIFREASFGHGELQVVNATHAHWSWHRNDDDEAVVADKITITSVTACTTPSRSS
ncbi:purple acid phosphatase 18 [Selaginella moellendorffii]|uniref:purple acid phosphatase 18 n=1 Tax=Selaginella moellendorffii TaxID=88036 RepID=UPI000D1CBAE7|nr:purple acid phosphatase 18 [Selaginella moellendorffii]|eukprot:XP_024515979.1 purple acid phosphatase 18 [Selaginella moellendorffii]